MNDNSARTPQEQALLRYFRQKSEKDQECILEHAEMIAKLRPRWKLTERKESNGTYKA